VSQKNLELVRRAVDAFNRRDADAVLACMQPDYELHTYSEPPEEAAVYRGQQAVRVYHESLFGDFERIQREIDEVLDTNDHVAISVRQRAWSQGTDHPIERHFFEVYWVRDGLLAKSRSYATRAEALEAARREGSTLWGRLSKGVKALVGAVIAMGAVAGAIGAILALWPDPTPELGAELSDVSVIPNVTLSEYAIRHQEQTAGAPERATSSRLATHLPAQAESDDETTPTTGPTTTTTPTTPTTTTGPTTTTTTETEEGPILGVEIGEQARAQLQEGLARALGDPAVPQINVGSACEYNLSDSSCGLSTVSVYAQWTDEDGDELPSSPAVVGEHLATLLAGTRTQPAASNEGQLEPVGVSVSFNVTLTGFRGHRVDVRWSLYAAEGDISVPQDWLQDQRALWLEGEANRDSATGEFWVPLPRVQGPFFIRIGVYDDEGTRLAYADTRRVR
jgi:ketosteroid isomerase-like protein